MAAPVFKPTAEGLKKRGFNMDNKWSYLKNTVKSTVSSAFHLQGPKQEVRGCSAGCRELLPGPRSHSLPCSLLCTGVSYLTVAAM